MQECNKNRKNCKYNGISTGILNDDWTTALQCAKNKQFIDFGTPDDVVTEDNLRKAYSIDVKLIELDNKRKVCVPLKTNLKSEIN